MAPFWQESRYEDSYRKGVFFMALAKEQIRQIITENNFTIEGLNRQYRKVTKTKSVFPSDTSLEKMLYLSSGNITRKWTQRYRNWDQVLGQLIILYEERLTEYL